MKFPISALAIVTTLAACGGDATPAASPAPVAAAAPAAPVAAPEATAAATEAPAVAEAKPAEPPAAPKTIVDVAAANSEFSTLVSALKEAGLDDDLKAEGPFTVFAPTDEAFKKLPKGALEKLLKDKKKLAKVLQNHVVQGKFDLAKAKDATTLSGGKLKFKTGKDGAISVGKGLVTKSEIEAANGVIHVVDAVLMP
jgi:uncharacterized surface protein with fasciclin (FAS1) repeats